MRKIKDDKKMFLARFLYRNLRGYRLLIVLAVILTLVEVVASILTVYPFKFIIDADKYILNAIKPEGTPLDRFVLEQIFPLAKKYSPLGGDLMGQAITTILVMGILSAFLSFVQLRIASLIAKSLTARLSKHLFNHLQQLSVGWHNTQEQGDLIQRVTGNMADIEKFAAD